MGSVPYSIQIVSISTQGCILGEASGSGEAGQNAHSKDSGVGGEPPTAWVQFLGPTLKPRDPLS